MATILENAADSIALGIEDIQTDDPKRALSAIRNFHAGVVLLGKACLLSKAETADPAIVLAARHKLVPDGHGNVRIEARGHATIDVGDLKQRFEDFGFTWVNGDAKTAFTLLRRIRNAVEHFSHSHSQEEIKKAVGACYPIVAEFFDLLGKNPADHLGASWTFMAEQEQLYRKLVEECLASLSALPWANYLATDEPAACTTCGLSLLKQSDPKNADPEMIDPLCHGCGATYGTEEFVGLLIGHAFYADAYLAVTQGGEDAWVECPRCGCETFVLAVEEPTCFLCSYNPKEECQVCGRRLTPDVEDDGNLCQDCWKDISMHQ